MKTSLFRTSTLILSAATLLTMNSCKGDDPMGSHDICPTDELSSLSFDADGIWSRNNEDIDFTLGAYKFSHSLTEWMTVEGFTPSRSSDNAYHDPMFQWLYTVMPGHGPSGQDFISAFWSNREGDSFDQKTCSISRTDGETFTPDYIMVTNSCYAYYSMTRGDAYAKKFGKGDWFRLTAHGVKANGSENLAEFYLANITDAEHPENGIVKDWKRFDLSSLGSVKGIYFTLDSSDSGEWGMNTPASFAVAGFNVLTETPYPSETNSTKH